MDRVAVIDRNSMLLSSRAPPHRTCSAPAEGFTVSTFRREPLGCCALAEPEAEGVDRAAFRAPRAGNSPHREPRDRHVSLVDGRSHEASG
jgi:hypothetical protein